MLEVNRVGFVDTNRVCLMLDVNRVA